MKHNTRRIEIELRNDTGKEEPIIALKDNKRPWVIDITYKKELCPAGVTSKIDEIIIKFID